MDGMTILVGIGAGISYALTGFAKSSGEKLDYMKFGATVLLGAGVGVIATLVEAPIETSYLYVSSVGAVALLENLIKAVYRGITAKKKK